MIEARQYQDDVQDAIATSAAKGHRRILLQAPTGSGKTVIASKIIKHAADNGQRVMFLAHRKELVWQSSAKLTEIGINHGVIMADYPHDPTLPIQVGSVQSLHAKGIRRKKIDLPLADLVILDEAHHTASSKTWLDVVNKYPSAFILGLTATPITKAGLGLGDHYDDLICCPSISDLTGMGFLVPAKYYAPSIPDLAGVHVRAGDYVESEIEERVDRPKLIGDICENWARICPDRKTLVFGVSIKHSIHLAESFRAIGIKAEHIDGGTPGEDRQRIVEAFKTGDVQVLCNCAVFNEGFDAPQASALVFARPTKSLGLYLQVAGRVLRPASGKKDAIIIDHSGVLYEHGLLDQSFDWKLTYGKGGINEARKEAKKDKLRRQITCGTCKQVYEGRLTCPSCGWKPMLKGKPVETYEAYLQELTALEKPPATTDPLVWYRGFLWYADTKGYKSGWAFHKFQEKFSRRPVFPLSEVRPVEPPKDVLAWIRSRQIAWAMSHKNPSRRPPPTPLPPPFVSPPKEVMDAPWWDR